MITILLALIAILAWAYIAATLTVGRLAQIAADSLTVGLLSCAVVPGLAVGATAFAVASLIGAL